MNNNITYYIEDFLNHKRGVENKAITTINAYRHDLKGRLIPFLQEQNIFEISQITQHHIEQFLVFIKKGSKNGSVANMNRKLASIKSFFVFLQQRGLVQTNPASDIKSPKNHAKTISYLTEEEKDRLLNTVETTATPYYKARDITIFKLFLGTGIRVSELINLTLQDLELRTREISYIHIKRKGGNEMRVPINSKLASAIKTYVTTKTDISFSSYVFLSRSNKKMEANSVYYLVKHYLEDAGIEKKKHGPHILRHTVGVSLRRKGIDIATIQQLLGHKKLETTAIYLNVESQDLEKAVQLL